MKIFASENRIADPYLGLGKVWRKISRSIAIGEGRSQRHIGEHRPDIESVRKKVKGLWLKFGPKIECRNRAYNRRAVLQEITWHYKPRRASRKLIESHTRSGDLPLSSANCRYYWIADDRSSQSYTLPSRIAQQQGEDSIVPEKWRTSWWSGTPCRVVRFTRQWTSTLITIKWSSRTRQGR